MLLDWTSRCLIWSLKSNHVRNLDHGHSIGCYSPHTHTYMLIAYMHIHVDQKYNASPSRRNQAQYWYLSFCPTVIQWNLGQGILSIVEIGPQSPCRLCVDLLCHQLLLGPVYQACVPNNKAHCVLCKLAFSGIIFCVTSPEWSPTSWHIQALPLVSISFYFTLS